MSAELETKVAENPQPTQPENTAPVENATTEKPEDINWKKFREQRELDRKQMLETEKKAQEKAAEAEALKAAMDAILNKPSRVPANQSDEELSEDERLQMRINAALEDRDRKAAEARKEQEMKESFGKAAKTFSDFNAVYTQENCDYLEYHHPELFNTLKNEPDSFDKWSRVYNALKRYIPNADSKKEQKKAEKNFGKPQSPSVPGSTQVGDSAPIKLDDKRRQDNWSRMQKVMKGVR